MTNVESLTYVFYDRCGTGASRNTVFHDPIALLHFIEKHVASKKKKKITRSVFFCKMRTPEHHPEKCFWGTYFTRNSAWWGLIIRILSYIYRAAIQIWCVLRVFFVFHFLGKSYGFPKVSCFTVFCKQSSSSESNAL